MGGSDIFTLAELVRHAREHSPFYRQLYAGLAGGAVDDVAQLPVVDQAAFWAANTLENNRVLTAPLGDGIIFKSGGTTGAPKFSAFTAREWAAFTKTFGRGMAARGLRANDRVANLFYVGDLYASFLFIMKSIENAPVATLHLPIGGATPFTQTTKHLLDFSVNVVAGLPTSLLALAADVTRQQLTLPKVERILFGGESFYADQKPLMARAFPNAEIISIGYASVDAGTLGYADLSCRDGEHRVFTPETILEIVDDETGRPITEAGVAGKVLLTCLTRKLMPIIRYPVGDRAIWVDGQDDAVRGRRFEILGRSEEGARVGPVTVYLEDVRQVLRAILPAQAGYQYQLAVRHFDGKDQLEFRVALDGQESISADKLRELTVNLGLKFDATRPMHAQLAAEGKIHPLAVKWIRADELAVNPRTGKLLLLADLRR